mgnify:CR=1 FL=1
MTYCKNNKGSVQWQLEADEALVAVSVQPAHILRCYSREVYSYSYMYEIPFYYEEQAMSERCMCGATDCQSCGPAQGVPWCHEHQQPVQDCYDANQVEESIDSADDWPSHWHSCPICTEGFECYDEDCSHPYENECASCIASENIRYSNEAN